MENVSYKNIKINGGFWKEKQDMINNVTLQAVYDRFYDTKRFQALECKWVEGEPDCPHVFWDSDIAKWLEGLAYSLSFCKNDELEKIADECIQNILDNRDENGYFNSHFLVTGERFTNRNEHELYCAGHLMEAAVAYYDATGKRELLDAMCKYADYIEKVFVHEKSASFATPGHPEIELALFKLYKATGEKRYLELSKFFIDSHGNNSVDKEVYNDFNLLYNQDEMPLRQRNQVDGHCVRALYLLSAMADIAKEYDDEELKNASERCFENVVNKRMYITGATGSSHIGEAFTIDYDLPNRTAYAETCASIALSYFASRMTKLNKNGKYADIVEKVLYNGILSGVSMDGKSFFYENPLEIDPDFNNANTSTHQKEHYPITQRKEVFDCSCCPPNIIRLISSVGDFIYSLDGDTVFVNQYIQSEAEFNGIKISQATDYPSSGVIKINVEGNAKIALRIPGWCNNFTLNCEYDLIDGYAYVKNAENEILLNLNMSVKFVSANKKVHSCAGRVAVMRGPVVYCIEGIDNGKDLQSIRVDINSDVKEADSEFIFPSLTLDAYQEKDSESLYFDATDSYDSIKIKMIPYFAFANRGESDMLVWILKK